MQLFYIPGLARVELMIGRFMSDFTEELVTNQQDDLYLLNQNSGCP